VQQDGPGPRGADDHQPSHYVFPPIPPGGAVSCPSLGLGVVGLAEVGPEAVVQSEAHVGRRGHDDIGHDPALQAAHAVGQHDLGHRPQRFEAAGQHLQGRGRLLVGGETYEAPTRKGHHRTEDVQAGLSAPVDDEHLAGRPHPRAAAAVVARAPVPLGFGHQAPEVAGRAGIARGPGLGQQALGRYAGRGLVHPLGHDLGDDVEVVLARRPVRGVGRGPAGHGVLHGLGVDTADGGRPPIGAYVVVRSDDVHSFPLSLQ
jgi:hypothetical protein